MKTRGSSVMRLATPMRAWAQRVALALMISTAFVLMVMSKTDTVPIERLRSAVTDALAPILELMSAPVQGVRRLAGSIAELTDLRTENMRLREENARLLEWRNAALSLQHENQALRTLLKATQDPASNFITARIIGDNGGAFVRTLLVNAGARDGVHKNQAALAGEGLVGRVVEVGERASRVLMITDINSRIPVVLERSRDHAVLAGDNGPLPLLDHLAPDARPAIGDRVVTSGFGGVFPPGVPVGTVVHIDDKVVRVTPLVAWSRIDFLRLVDYRAADLAGLSPAIDGIVAVSPR